MLNHAHKTDVSRRHALMLAVTLVAAACYPAIKAGLVYAPPVRFAWLRTIIAGVLLLGILAALKAPVWPTAAVRRWILPLGLAATTLTFGGMFLSPAHTGAGIASALGNTQPLAIIVLGSIFVHEKLTGRKFLALCLGLAGVAVMALSVFGGENEHDTVGAMLALISSAGAGVATIMVRRLRPGRDLMALAGWQLVVGALPLLAFSQVFESGRAIHWTASFAGILLFLALAGSALTTLIWFWALQKWDAGTLSLYLFLVPVFGVAIAVAIYGESIRLADVAGILLILVAMAVALFERSNGIDGKRRASIRPQP